MTEDNHEKAVADGVNVGFDVDRIRTRITETGSTVEAEHVVDKRDRLTRAVRWETLDDDLVYDARALDRDVVAQDQIRTAIRTYRETLFTDEPAAALLDRVRRKGKPATLYDLLRATGPVVSRSARNRWTRPPDFTIVSRGGPSRRGSPCAPGVGSVS